MAAACLLLLKKQRLLSACCFFQQSVCPARTDDRVQKTEATSVFRPPEKRKTEVASVFLEKQRWPLFFEERGYVLLLHVVRRVLYVAPRVYCSGERREAELVCSPWRRRAIIRMGDDPSVNITESQQKGERERSHEKACQRWSNRVVATTYSRRTITPASVQHYQGSSRAIRCAVDATRTSTVVRMSWQTT